MQSSANLRYEVDVRVPVRSLPSLLSLHTADSVASYSKKAMVWTDKRARLIGELLSSMRVLKFFGPFTFLLSSLHVLTSKSPSSRTAWEVPYLKKLQGYRAKELVQIRSLLIIRAATTGVAMSLPTLATGASSSVFSNSNSGLIDCVYHLFDSIAHFLLFFPISSPRESFTPPSSPSPSRHSLRYYPPALGVSRLQS